MIGEGQAPLVAVVLENGIHWTRWGIGLEIVLTLLLAALIIAIWWRLRHHAQRLECSIEATTRSVDATVKAIDGQREQDSTMSSAILDELRKMNANMEKFAGRLQFLMAKDISAELAKERALAGVKPVDRKKKRREDSIIPKGVPKS